MSCFVLILVLVDRVYGFCVTNLLTAFLKATHADLSIFIYKRHSSLKCPSSCQFLLSTVTDSAKTLYTVIPILRPKHTCCGCPLYLETLEGNLLRHEDTRPLTGDRRFQVLFVDPHAATIIVQLQTNCGLRVVNGQRNRG